MHIPGTLNPLALCFHTLNHTLVIRSSTIDQYSLMMEFLKSLTNLRRELNGHNLVEFVIHWGLLQRVVQCVCGGAMYLKRNGPKRDLIYQCGTRECRIKRSVRNGSIFQMAEVKIEILLEVLLAWILKYPTSVMLREIDISKNTLCKVLCGYRQLIFDWLIITSQKIGGVGHTVEVDESVFGKRKYNRGRRTATKWVVGGIDRTTKKCFLTFVNRRDAVTLQNVIIDNVEVGTTIYTDMWRGYINLNNIGYFHAAVNHSENFVDPNDPNVHTQNVEANWSKIKRDSRRRLGRMSIGRIDFYLSEYVWRSIQQSPEELFIDFLAAAGNFE